MRSDLGPPFHGSEFQNYLKSLGIKHLPTLPENPQNNEVENFNRLIRKSVDIAKVRKEDYKTWVRRMLMVVRATPSKATKVSPAYYGKWQNSQILYMPMLYTSP